MTKLHQVHCGWLVASNDDHSSTIAIKVGTFILHCSSFVFLIISEFDEAVPAKKQSIF